MSIWSQGVYCSLRVGVKQCCPSTADLFSLSLPFVWQLVRLNLVPLSFPTSGPPLFVGRTLSPSFPSASVSQNAVVFLVLVWIQFELGQLGILVTSFVDSLADCSRVSCRFPLEFPYELGWFHDLSHDLSQCRPGERWRPRGPSHRSYLCLGRVSACE